MKMWLRCRFAIGLIPIAAYGHHSSVGRFDSETIIEIEGKVMEMG